MGGVVGVSVIIAGSTYAALKWRKRKFLKTFRSVHRSAEMTSTSSATS